MGGRSSGMGARTDGLDEEGGAVEGEENDVEEEEDGLDSCERVRVLLEAGERDVDGTSAHADGELWGA